MAEIDVKVCKLNEPAKEVTLAEGATVADALAAAGYPTDSRVKVDGSTVSSDYTLEDGDRVLITQKVEGGL